MTREEKNKEIAKILGFKEYGIKINGIENAEFAWACPDEYSYLITGSPMWHLPDFIGMLDDLRIVAHTVRFHPHHKGIKKIIT